METNTQSHNRKIRTFLVKLLIAGVLLVGLDFVLGLGLKYLFFAQKSGPHQRATYIIEEGEEEMVILGSSRAYHQYVPEIFTDSLGYSCYNTGRGGQSVLYCEAILKALLERYTPKMVVMDLNTLELYEDSRFFDRLSVLLPYYPEHPEIQSVLQLRNKWEDVKMYSRVYPYNSMILTMLKYQFSEQVTYQGYRPLSGVLETDTLPSLDPMPGAGIDDRKVRSLKTIVELCRDNEIPLVMVLSPLQKRLHKNESVDRIEQIAQEQGIPFLDFSHHPDFLAHPEWFKDYTHLNDDGARIFSAELAQKLIQMETAQLASTALK